MSEKFHQDFESNLAKLNSLKKEQVEEGQVYFNTIFSAKSVLTKKVIPAFIERYPFVSEKVQFHMMTMFLKHRIAEAVPAFLKELARNDHEDEKRDALIKTITDINTPEGYTGLTRILAGTGTKQVIRAILKNYVALDDARWAMACWSLANLENGQRKYVLNLMAKVDYRRTTKFVINSLNSSATPEDQREFLVKCFHELNIIERYLTLLKSLDSEQLVMSARALSKIESGIMDYFVEALSDRDDETRFKLLELLEQLGDDGLEEPLKYLLETDVNDKVVSKAIKVFSGFAGPNSVVSISKGLLRRADSRVRANTIEAIEEAGIMAADLMKDYLTDINNRVRANAAKAIAKTDPEAALKTLKNMLEEENPLMKASALWALGELRMPEHTSLVVPFADHPEEIVRRNAHRALEKLSNDKKEK